MVMVFSWFECKQVNIKVGGSEGRAPCLDIFSLNASKCQPFFHLPHASSLVSHGGGSPEVGEELEAQADHKVPDVPGHLGACDEDTPKEHHQDGVEGIADVPQSEITQVLL